MGGFFIALVAALWHFSPPVRRVRLSVRTRPSQGREAGSIPARATISFCPFRAGKAHSPRKPPFGLLPITRLQRQLRRSISPAGIAAFIGEFSVNLDAPRSEPSPCRFRRPGILARPVGDSSRRPQRSTSWPHGVARPTRARAGTVAPLFVDDFVRVGFVDSGRLLPEWHPCFERPQDFRGPCTGGH